MGSDLSQWVSEAACVGAAPDLFFADNGNFSGKKKTQKAIEICEGCSAVAACLEWALETGDQHAILGGMTPAQRQRHLRQVKREMR
jgi:WhiB family transcriptional regulator, redox-sensing transcriptional regulator